VVLPESHGDLLSLRPLGGTDDEVTGILSTLEPVEAASFDPPDPGRLGDFRSCRLLYDALRLGFRTSAGPFRSFGAIAVEPRPYQLVPLLMAMKLDPVRLLIADDVGIGKTIEACLIAKELLERGDIRRLAVLCPPHLAEQWEHELQDKFHLDPALVLASTAARLEQDCQAGQSLFERYPHAVVSVDFIKQERRRYEFLRTCPELVIVDEAHACVVAAGAGGRRSANHLRFELLRDLAQDPNRHLVLVTATPHSGNEDAFRALLALLRPEFASLPSDLGGPENEAHRRRLAEHFVQRRRGDIRAYLHEDTPFPERLETERTYVLSPSYKRLFERVITYVRESVVDAGAPHHRQRVRWWAALALLRALGSSPAAAATALRIRAAVADTTTEEEAEDLGRRTVFDLDPAEAAEDVDVVPGGDAEDVGESAHRRRLRELAREAESLAGDADAKLLGLIEVLAELLRAGARPIVFCRFIATAEYLGSELERRLSTRQRKVSVGVVTGQLPPAEREERVRQLGGGERPLLVCTDCLSEGINLQDWFDAVVHYDLSWNPTRHEQREGRVDRFGQKEKKVRIVTYYGKDNPIDGIVLDVLLRKHQTIRNSLGISVPVPTDSNAVVNAVLEGLLLRGERGLNVQGVFEGFESVMRPHRERLHQEWESATAKEKQSRTVFAQRGIRAEEVAAELAQARLAVGSGDDVRRFVVSALRDHGATITERGETVELVRTDLPRALRELPAWGPDQTLIAKFSPAIQAEAVCLSRTHPLVEGLASYVLDAALDPLVDGKARRAGSIRTGAVQRRTTLLLVRYRYQLVTVGGSSEIPYLAEEARLLAFEGAPDGAMWLPGERALALLDATPTGNVIPEQARDFVAQVVTGFDAIRPAIQEEATRRADELLRSHIRVRDASRSRGVRYRVEPKLPADVLGIYVFLPAPGAPTAS
jgi:superfamily II DNA or RNA helicase